LICKSCSSKECCEKYQNLEIECPECDGTGCDSCNRGRFNLSECPQKFIGDYISTFRLVDLFQKGIPPVAGGALNQTMWFIDAAATLKNEDAIVEEELTNGN